MHMHTGSDLAVVDVQASSSRSTILPSSQRGQYEKLPDGGAPLGCHFFSQASL